MKNKKMIKKLIYIILLFNILYSFEEITNKNNEIDPLTVLGPDIKLNKTKENNKDILLIEEKQKSIKENPIQKVYEAYQNLKENVAKGIDQFNQTASKFNLPIKANLTEDTVAKGSLKWSLVNDKCEPDPKAIFQKTIINIIKKYKKLIKKITEPNYWKMWLLNQTYEKGCEFIANLQCLTMGKWFDYVNKGVYTAEFQSCLQEELEGVTKLEVTSRGGVVYFGAGFTGGSGHTPSAPSGFTPGNGSVYYVPPCHHCGIYHGMTFTFGSSDIKNGATFDVKKAGKAVSYCNLKLYPTFIYPALIKCQSEKKKDCLSMFNGEIQFQLKMFGVNFKLAQQKCILNKYNMKINLNKVVTDFFELDAINNKKQSKGTIILKNNVIKEKDLEEIRINVLKKGTSFLEDEFDNLLTNSKVTNIEKFILLDEYKYILYNWLNDVFNQKKQIKEITKPPYIAKIPISGRWYFPTILGKNCKFWGTKCQKSVYEKCMEVASMEPNVLFNSYVIKNKKFFEYYLFYDNLIFNDNFFKNFYNNKKYYLQDKNFDYKLYILMNNLCLRWANDFKYKLEEAKNSVIKQTNIKIFFNKYGKKLSDNTEKLLKSFMKTYIDDLEHKIKLLETLIETTKNNVNSYTKYLAKNINKEIYEK